MKFTLYLGMITLLTCHGALCATADNTINIHYSGTVHIPPCTVVTDKVAVNFEPIVATDLKNTGQMTDWKEFSISLTNCDSNSVVVKTSGTPSSNKNYYLPVGTASNVDVELSDDEGMVYSNGASKTYTLLPDATSIDIPFKTRLRNNGQGEVSPGTVSSTITVDFDYN